MFSVNLNLLISCWVHVGFAVYMDMVVYQISVISSYGHKIIEVNSKPNHLLIMLKQVACFVLKLNLNLFALCGIGVSHSMSVHFCSKHVQSTLTPLFLCWGCVRFAVYIIIRVGRSNSYCIEWWAYDYGSTWARTIY